MLALIFRCLVALAFVSFIAALTTHLLTEVFDWSPDMGFTIAFVFAAPFSMAIGVYFAEAISRGDF